MNLKKFLAVIISSSIAASSVIMNVNAMETPIVEYGADNYIVNEAYTVQSGVIKEIYDYFDLNDEIVEGRKNVLVVSGTDEDEAEFTFVINEDTYFFEGTMEDLKEGANITGLYDSSRPMLMIYPPQFSMEYLAVGYDEISEIMVDRFDENFVDSQNYIKLNLSDKNITDGVTEIIYEDGKEFEGTTADLANRKLLVYYGVTTRSIPAITTPEKIIILYENAAPPVYTITDEERKNINQELENALIRVNGNDMKNKAYISDKGYVMVPLREIAEAMDLTVLWFGDTRTVQIGKSLLIALDKDEYAYNRMMPISIGEAPVLRDSLTYVPIEFFTVSELGAVSSGYSSGFNEELGVCVIDFILREDK